MKKIIALLLISVMAVTAAGCRYFDATEYLASITYTEAPAEPTSEPTPDPTEKDTTPEPTIVPTQDPYPGLPDDLRDISDTAKMAVMKAKEIMDNIIDYISLNPITEGTPAQPFIGQNLYRTLAPHELSLYENLLASAKSFTDLSFDYPEDEVVARVLNALFIDHPEIEIYFAVEKDAQTGEGEAQTVTSYHTVFFLPEGRYYESAADMEEVKAEAEAFEAVAAYVAGRIPADFSTIDKYRALAYYITANTSYLHLENEETPRYAMNAYGAIVNGHSICQGYAFGFEYLCRAANLACRRLTNGLTGDNMHFWDEITLLGGTYYVDVTWADGTATNYRDIDWFRWFLFVSDSEHIPNDGTSTTGPALNKTGWAG